MSALGLAVSSAQPSAAAEPAKPAPSLGSGEQTAKPPTTLSEHIEVVLSEPFLSTATVGISVVDGKNGKILYERNADTPLNPASNIKLITTAAALSLLGPEHRYSTRVYREEGALEGNTIKGDVYLRGSGDPQLVTEDIYALAMDIRALGIKRITGGIVVDASHFDRDELPPGFDQKDELASYRAPSGATAVNFNSFLLRVRPAEAEGGLPIAHIEPPVRSIKLVNESRTVAGWRRHLIVGIDEDKNNTIVRLTGTIGVDAGAASYRYPIEDPSRYAGEVLALSLRHHGIRLGRARIKSGPIPSDARLVATHHSDPLSTLTRGVNKFSNNFMAEQILKTLAAPDVPCTFDTALARVRTWLRARGIVTTGLRLGNGSGLYDTNRVTPRQLSSLLLSVSRDFQIAPDYLASLSIMGADGTTRSRLRETMARRWIRAKTGTLDGVSALSGYVSAPGRDPIVFSLLFNDLDRGDTTQARAAQDRIAELLARYAAGKPLVDPVEAAVESAG